VVEVVEVVETLCTSCASGISRCVGVEDHALGGGLEDFTGGPEAAMYCSRAAYIYHSTKKVST
jgi:hypothetical protein